MNYKYKRGQIFGKRLKIPRNILTRVYSNRISFSEFIKYDLEDKIPISCIIETDREIVEKFGIEKCKTLDWELLNKNFYYSSINAKQILLNMDSSTEDLNESLYELVKDEIRPNDYSSQMKERYSDRLFDIQPIDNTEFSYEKGLFNEGKIQLKEILENWELFKDKDLSYCLLKDKNNVNNITNNDVKQLMNKCENLHELIVKNTDIYSFIAEYRECKNNQEENEYIKKFTDDILRQNYRDKINLSDEQYKELFKYSSIGEYLKLFYEYGAEKIAEELKELPQDYVFNTPIPFTELKSYGVLSFVSTYGLKNIVDFDNECGHFFSKNNCEMLKLMYDMYIHYAANEHDPNKRIFTQNGNYNDKPYTKDEFYEAMKRMIIYGPSDVDYVDKAPDYRDMIGEFRKRNSQLFISDNAPEELKNAFYTKSITPRLLVKNPEYIPYIEGKDLESCFKVRDTKVIDSKAPYGYENLYKFLSEKEDFNTVIKFITQYSDVLDIVFDRSLPESYKYETQFSTKDTLDEIQRKISESLKRIIIEKDVKYPAKVPQSLIRNYPSMFLSPDAPKELKKAFYNRNITTDFILSNPEYKEYLKNVDIEALYKYMPVQVTKENSREYINFTAAIKEIFENEEALNVMLMYGKYIETAFEKDRLQDFKFSHEFSKENLLDEIDNQLLKNIVNNQMKYDEKMPEHFKENNPTLFLNPNISEEIRNKFYNREFTINDFVTNPELIETFGDTNIVCGFSEEVSWMIPLFNDKDNTKEANYNRLKVISAYSKIQDESLKKSFQEYIKEFDKDINVEKIEYISKVLSSLSLSNSSEIFRFRKELATQILKSNNPVETLGKIEDIFIRNNIPTFGKVYSCFETLHPDLSKFNFSNSIVSPVLAKSSNIRRKVIIFSDLVKSSFGSNNLSVNSFLKNIETGNSLYEQIKEGQIQYNDLDESEKKELNDFSKTLSTLYNNTMKNRNKSESFYHTDNVISDISELSKKLSPNGSLDYNLGDRVIRMFCGFAGINTIEEAKEYINSKINTANTRNRNAAEFPMILEQGDFVKGIGDIKYLRNILQNGSVSKEYLGTDATSDSTPLDTDVSMITDAEGSNEDKILKTAANGYGPIYFVLKNDDRFITTRSRESSIDVKQDMSKMEVFYTGVLGKDHYGIRTGFPSSEINYIVMENYDNRVGLEIAMNGFYIPVANKEGEIIFTPKDYDNLREKMAGLSYYGENNFKFSENLVTSDIESIASQLDECSEETELKKHKINKVIKKSLDELGQQLKTTIDGDLSNGFVELIDTGSTGRGTNKPGDGDFDFMMRLDREILINQSEMEKFKHTLLKNLGKENTSEITDTGDFRLKKVQIDNDTNVDIDITFSPKTDKISYSTDMALQDRLSTIKELNPEKYKYVVANIILAKKVLKQANAYKPNRGDEPQGGLGGVGVENWILQNGGSFKDAAESFIKAAEGKSFEEFKNSYYIWDFGENHLSERRDIYSHDNFIANNMSEIGYKKMVQSLKEYVKNHSKSVESLAEESIELQKDVTFLDEIEYDQQIQEKSIIKSDNIQIK